MTVGNGLSRRTFLAMSAAGVAAASGLGDRSVLHRSAGGGPASGPRGPATRIMNLDPDWLFGGAFVTGSTAPDFDDSRFTPVTLPHTVTALSWRLWEPTSWQNIWIYRRHFDRPTDFADLRMFLEITAAMTDATLTLNGHLLPTHRGGYLPFTSEVTSLLQERDNVLAVALDSNFQLDVPPDRPAPYAATSIDFYQPGGLYRHARLYAVPSVYISDVFAKPVDVLSSNRHLDVTCTVDAGQVPTGSTRIEVVLSDGATVVRRAWAPVTITTAGTTTAHVVLDGLSEITLWDLARPQLYDVTTTLVMEDRAVHNHRTRTGFRDARFTERGFSLNGRRVKIFGLNRHQFYPFAGGAMADRVQQRDALILHDALNCNMVRCSHYPQSEAFLDACDELGMMVWEEAPGWGYLGDSTWLAVAYQNVHDMIVRDRNHPSIIIWGARLNETPNNIPFDTSTNELAHSLDDSRPTSGAITTTLYVDTNAEFVMDVFACNDYTVADGHASLHPPRPGLPYLVTEAVGSLSGPSPHYRRTDPVTVQQGQTVAHAYVHDIAASSNRYCGLLAWCAFDYCSGNGLQFTHVKSNGVCTLFRVPKPGAAIYRAQVDPDVRPVIEPAFYWDFGPTSPSEGPGVDAVICSNCDRLEVTVDGKPTVSVLPNRTRFPHLGHPPTTLDLTTDGTGIPGLRIDGFVRGEKVLTRSFSADHAQDRLSVVSDDDTIQADGSDATRVTFRAVDRFGNPRPYVKGMVRISLSGPAVLVGDNPFAFEATGGVGAVWVRSLLRQSGVIGVSVTHAPAESGTGLGHGHVSIRAV